MAVHVSVKGPAASAKREAARHGVALRNVRQGRFSVHAEASCKSFSKIVRWMGSPGHPHMKQGRGAPPGTLLFHSTVGCGAGELRGGLAGPSPGRLALYIGAPAAVLGAVYLIMRSQAQGVSPGPEPTTVPGPAPGFVPSTRSGAGHF